MIEALDMSRRVGKTYLTNKMKEEICKCGHHVSFHVQGAGCFHSNKEKGVKRKNLVVSMDDVDCDCNKFVKQEAKE